MSSSKASQYTIAKVLHWIAGIFIGFNLLSGWRLATFDLNIKEILVSIHASVGIVVLLLMLIRWWWRRKNDLYAPPNWWKRWHLLLQWIFYPLLLIQPVIGLCVALFNDYSVKAFGIFDISSLGGDNPASHALFLDLHTWLAFVLIALVLAHGADRLRVMYS